MEDSWNWDQKSLNYMFNPLNDSIKLGDITVGNLAYNQAMLN